jgi:hypothetical protein
MTGGPFYDTHRRDPQWRLNVDSGRPVSANSRHSQAARMGQIHPLLSFPISPGTGGTREKGDFG